MSDNKDLLRPDNIGKDVKRLNNRPLLILGSILLLVLLILSFFILKTPNKNVVTDKDITVSKGKAADVSVSDDGFKNNDLKFVEDLAAGTAANNNSILKQEDYANQIPGFEQSADNKTAADNKTEEAINAELKEKYERMNLPPIPVSDEVSNYTIAARGGKQEISPELMRTKTTKDFTAFEEALKARTLVFKDEKKELQKAVYQPGNTKRVGNIEYSMDESIYNMPFEEYYKNQMNMVNKIVGDIAGNQPNAAEEKNNQKNTSLYSSEWRLQSKVEASDSLMVRAGSIIPGTLISGINSDLAGQVIAQVRQNVYDTESGFNLLIPQGSRLVGEYISDIAYGQNRLFMVWKRIVFPNGEALDLQDGMPGADLSGYAGFKDKVNHHLVRVFGSAILMSGIIAGIELSQQSITADSNSLVQNASSALSAALGQSLGETMRNMIEKNMSISPTIEIRPGYLFNIMVIKDIKFDKPYLNLNNRR